MKSDQSNWLVQGVGDATQTCTQCSEEYPSISHPGVFMKGEVLFVTDSLYLAALSTTSLPPGDDQTRGVIIASCKPTL